MASGRTGREPRPRTRRRRSPADGRRLGRSAASGGANGRCRRPAGRATIPPFVTRSPLPMPHRLFFAHANGFPSETYRKLFALLEPDFHVHRLERHGHDPRYPVDANWNSLVAELIESLERLDG